MLPILISDVEHAEKLTRLALSVIEIARLAGSDNWYDVMVSRLDELDEELKRGKASRVTPLGEK